MQNKELKNTSLRECPFCGGEAELYNYETEHDIYDSQTLGYVDTEYSIVYGVGCELCGCIIAEKHSEEEAITTWNTRKPMDRIVEQLEDEAKSYLEYYPEDYIFELFDMVELCEEAIEIVKGCGNDE